MSLDLPILETPYPSKYPIYDIRQFLAEGAEPIGFGCWAQVQPNLVIAGIRARTNQMIDNRNFIVIGLPPELRPPTISPGIAMHYDTPSPVQVNQYGNIYFPGWLNRVMGDAAHVELSMTWPRRAV